MAKWKSDDAIDGGIDFTATCTLLSVVTDVSTPTDLTNSIASVAVDSGDFAKADGATEGRTLTVAAQLGLVASGAGTARHVVLSIAGVIHVITTVTAQAVESGGIINIPAWTDTINDPA